MVPPNSTPDPELVRMLEEAEQRYLRSLPPEHFMEATAQATQREITLESFALIRVTRPDIQLFNELLVQYPRKGRKKLGQVVPDNMVVVHPETIRATGSFSLQLQPARPFLVLEYVSKNSERKDYDDNYDRYEHELKVPYYLLFYPDNEELTVFRLAGERYGTVTPNAAGRLPIPELELEAALLDGWVRFWFRGELLPLPGELLGQLNTVRSQLTAERAARVAAERAADTERTGRVAAERTADTERTGRLAAEAEIARLREELARAKGSG
jgi:Uma2 family endonuclease